MLGAALRQEKQPLCNYFLTYMLLGKSEFNQAGRPCLIEEHGGSRNVGKSGGLRFRAGSLFLICSTALLDTKHKVDSYP